MAYICPICIRAVLDSEEGIGCDGPCQRWFHSGCLRMPKTEYQRLCSSSTKWYCTRSDCLDPTQQPHAMLLNQLSILTDKISDLANKVDSLVSLPAKVDNLISEMDNLNKNLSTLERRVSCNEDKLTSMESKVAKLGVSEGEHNPEMIIAEIHDRERRTRNVMLFNLIESPANDIETKKQHDQDLVRKLLTTFLPGADHNAIKNLRVGGGQKDKQRPVKLIFVHDTDAKTFLSGFSSELAAQIDQRLSPVRVSRDRTPRELKYLNTLREELNRRVSDGEKNLTIRYINNSPQIVQNQKNAQTPTVQNSN